MLHDYHEASVRRQKLKLKKLISKHFSRRLNALSEVNNMYCTLQYIGDYIYIRAIYRYMQYMSSIYSKYLHCMDLTIQKTQFFHKIFIHMIVSTLQLKDWHFYKKIDVNMNNFVKTDYSLLTFLFYSNSIQYQQYRTIPILFAISSKSIFRGVIVSLRLIWSDPHVAYLTLPYL